MAFSKEISRQTFRYLTTTIQSAAITLGLPWVLHDFGNVTEKKAVAIAFLCAFFINFFILKYWVFRSKNQTSSQLLTFAITSALFRGAEYLAFILLLHFLQINYLVSIFLILCISLICKFMVQKHMIFKQ